MICLCTTFLDDVLDSIFDVDVDLTMILRSASEITAALNLGGVVSFLGFFAIS